LSGPQTYFDEYIAAKNASGRSNYYYFIVKIVGNTLQKNYSSQRWQNNTGATPVVPQVLGVFSNCPCGVCASWLSLSHNH